MATKKTEQKKKAPEPIIEHTDVKHEFTITEIGELAKRAALANHRANELEEKKKQITKDYAAQVEAAQAEVNVLSAKISNGYEMRETECIVTLDPKNSSKDYHIKKTGEFVRRSEMTRQDFQITMRFEREKEAEEKRAAEAAGKVNIGEVIDQAGVIGSGGRKITGEEVTDADVGKALNEMRNAATQELIDTESRPEMATHD